MHTTCTVFINEFQTALLTDIHDFLEHLVARDADWKHNDPQHSDCDRHERGRALCARCCSATS